MKTSIQLEDYTVSFDDTRSKRDDVWEKIIEFVTKHKCFCGESVMQNEDTQIYSPELIAEIVELINFTVEEHED